MLVGITVMVALTNLIDLAWSAVLVPVWGLGARRRRPAVGALFATFAGASALGSLVAAAYADRLPRYATYLVCFLVTGLPRFVVMALDTPLWGILALCVVAGFASGFLNPILGAVIYERVPEQLIGRVSSLSTACCFALMPLGGLVGGFLVGGVGLGAAMLVCGAAYFVVTMLPAVDPRWRDIERKPPATGREDVPASRDRSTLTPGSRSGVPSGSRPPGRRAVQPGQLVVGELHVERADVLLEVLDPLGAGDRHDVVALLLHPGQRDLAGQHAVRLGHGRDLGDDRLVGGEVVVGEPRHPGPRVAARRMCGRPARR